jgi:hypothetical protein
MGIFAGANAFVTGAPFSAVEVVQTQEALTDGNTITRKYQTTIARDGQGRLRTEQVVTPPAGSTAQPHTIVTILDYVGQSRYVLDSSTMTAYQAPLRIPPAGAGVRGPGSAGTTRPNAPVVTTTSLPQQVVNGVLATGTQVVQTIAAGQIGNDKPIQISRQTWVAIDLKVPVQIRSSDPRFGTTVMDLTNIVQAEPNGSLFVVPAGYTVKQGRGGPGFGPGGPAGAGFGRAAALGARGRRGPGGPQ